MSVTAELGRRAMFAGLARMRSGRLEIAEDGRSFGFGAPDSSLRARVVDRPKPLDVALAEPGAAPQGPRTVSYTHLTLPTKA